MRLPDGLTVNLAINNHNGELVYCVEWTEKYVTQKVLAVLNQRIDRAILALKVCKHTKRKHRLTKLYNTLIKFRDEYQVKLNNLINDELPTSVEGTKQ